MSSLKKHCIVALVLFIFSIIFSLLYIQISTWDFNNYHYYSGWAFWNNRYDIDFMPATYRSYFNPILDAIDYLIISKLNSHPYIFLIIKNLRYMLFLFFSYLILDFVISDKKVNKNIILAFCLLITAFSPIIILISGYGLNDLSIALLLVISIYLIIRNLYGNKSKINFFLLILAGILIGSATAFKYPAGTFGFAVLVCVILQHKRIDKPIKTFLALLLGMGIGFSLFGAGWMYFLYNKFGNPLFPYFTNLFTSKYTDSNILMKSDFQHLKPHNIIEFIFWPLKNPKSFHVGSEYSFYDFIIPLSFISVIIHLLLNKFDNAAKRIDNIIKNEFLEFAIIFCGITYYINLFIFAQYRYITALYPLFLIIIAAVCYLIFTSDKIKSHQFNVITLILAITICLSISNFEALYRFKIIAILFLICTVAATLYFMFSEKLPIIQKNIYTSLCIITILFFATAGYDNSTYKLPYKIKKVIDTEQIQIEDNSNVLMGSVLTTVVIPSLNPNASYIAFGIPFNQKELAKAFKTNPDRYYYTDSIGEKVKEAFLSNKPLYFLYNAKEIKKPSIRKFYDEAIEYYSNGEIKGLENCQKIHRNDIGFLNSYGMIYICRLK